MVIERWRAVARDRAYEVSDAGRVRRGGKVLCPRAVGGGYRVVSLCRNGIAKNAYIAVLVATAFVPNPLRKPHVNHVDNDRTNNRASNLEWVTRQENMQHCAAQNRQRLKKRPVLRISLRGGVKYYESIAATKTDGFSAGNVMSCLAGRRPRHKGFVWVYA